MLTVTRTSSLNIEALAQVIPLGHSDTILGVLPFFHVFGFTGTWWRPACRGMGSIYRFSCRSTRASWASSPEKPARPHSCSTPPSVPARPWMRRVEPEKSSRACATSSSGAEKPARGGLKAFQEKYGLFPLEGYGATELSPVASINIPNIEWPNNKQIGTKPGTVGGCSAGRVHQGRRPRDGHRSSGPAWARASSSSRDRNVMKGLRRRRGSTRAVIRDGYYITGDIGKIGRGRLRHADRPPVALL